MITVNEKYRIKGDKVIWIIYILFILISLVEVFSSMGKTVKESRGGDVTSMFFKHFLMLSLGIGVCYISHLINYVKYSRIAKPAMLFSFILLAITLILGYLGPGGKAASRWIVIPLVGQFQPSEIVKYITIIFVATFLAANKDKIKEKQTFINVFLPILFICGLIFPENFSTAALIGLVCYIMLLVGGINRRYWALSLLGLLVAFVFIMFVDSKTGFLSRGSTWGNRIDLFLNNDRMEINQTNIALMAISTGGLTGKFIGNTEIARFLSESHNDFIFAIMLEEGGLWMCLLIVLLYIILLYRMLLIAKHAKGDFGSMLVLGVTLVFIFQAIINMMVSTNLLPVTGQTLPFISYGGTSFIFSSFALGMVLNVSRNENQKSKREIIIEEDISSLDTTNKEEEDL
ncbi:MAG: FtsW/RodA/SpoVE family cell cycle protein [Bacteroidota bacterium]|nr:FtsW/RodA/SpoVE family cell cycle protein [Bacteroidota bacterium]